MHECSELSQSVSLSFPLPQNRQSTSVESCVSRRPHIHRALVCACDAMPGIQISHTPHHCIHNKHIDERQTRTHSSTDRPTMHTHTLTSVHKYVRPHGPCWVESNKKHDENHTHITLTHTCIASLHAHEPMPGLPLHGQVLGPVVEPPGAPLSDDESECRVDPQKRGHGPQQEGPRQRPCVRRHQPPHQRDQPVGVEPHSGEEHGRPPDAQLGEALERYLRREDEHVRRQDARQLVLRPFDDQ
mmetsp:Transcript_53172/g.133860  ORF Transcript_53172/g.133860 Transcript_53172/m.133860 type:complete len:243 (-) Transcript_53172:911-1639(-)